MRDMQHFRKIPALMENPRCLANTPRNGRRHMNDMFTIDGKPNQPVRKNDHGDTAKKKLG